LNESFVTKLVNETFDRKLLKNFDISIIGTNKDERMTETDKTKVVI